jgi:hypothetical protein
MFSQFLFQDLRDPKDYQTGLLYPDGRDKPALQAFKLPFWAEARSGFGQDVVVLFGQVRPTAGPERAQIQMRGADRVWRPVQTIETRATGDTSCGGSLATEFMTDSEGFYLRLTPYQGTVAYRVRWIKADGSSEYGVPIKVGAPEPLPASP